MKPGELVCLKSTGELCVILGPAVDVHPQEGHYQIRRPVMTHDNGIKQVTEDVYAFELETEEEHLRREAKSMLLKVKIQDEMTEQLESEKKDKLGKLLVN